MLNPYALPPVTVLGVRIYRCMTVLPSKELPAQWRDDHAINMIYCSKGNKLYVQVIEAAGRRK